MQLPNVDANDICLRPDSSIENWCSLVDGEHTPPYPPLSPPRVDSSKPGGAADFTFHLAAGVKKSSTEKFAPEYYLNEKPWQLFRGSMKPLLFVNLSEPSAQSALEKPVLYDLPIGSAVDLLIENQLNDTIPLYKHGKPAWLLGSQAYANFPWRDVIDAVRDAEHGATLLNLHNPPLVVVHDLPPLGWSVLRFKVTTKTASMIHAAKLRYFAVSQDDVPNLCLPILIH
jgi:L-ascorbate oxidase